MDCTPLFFYKITYCNLLHFLKDNYCCIPVYYI